MASLFQKSGQPMVQTTQPTPGKDMQPLWQKLLGAAGTGADALGGDATALNRMMNPAWSQLQPFFDKLRSQAGLTADAASTAQGGGGAAFDSTRAAAMKGAEMSNIDSMMAQMKYGDVQNTLSRALQMSEGVMGMGMGSRQETPTQWSPFTQLAGLAMQPFGGGTGLLGLFNQGQQPNG